MASATKGKTRRATSVRSSRAKAAAPRPSKRISAYTQQSPNVDEWIWDWQCKMFIYSCALYANDLDCVMSDTAYDQFCAMLARAWDKLPEWFKQRVDMGNLTTGTTVGLKLTERDLREALEWRDRVKPDASATD